MKVCAGVASDAVLLSTGQGCASRGSLLRMRRRIVLYDVEMCSEWKNSIARREDFSAERKMPVMTGRRLLERQRRYMS